jgi:hypothetical protein
MIVEKMTSEELEAEILCQMLDMNQPWTEEEYEELCRVMKMVKEEVYGKESLQPNAKRS